VAGSGWDGSPGTCVLYQRLWHVPRISRIRSASQLACSLAVAGNARHLLDTGLRFTPLRHRFLYAQCCKSGRRACTCSGSGFSLYRSLRSESFGTGARDRVERHSPHSLPQLDSKSMQRRHLELLGTAARSAAGHYVCMDLGASILCRAANDFLRLRGLRLHRNSAMRPMKMPHGITVLHHTQLSGVR